MIHEIQVFKLTNCMSTIHSCLREYVYILPAFLSPRSSLFSFSISQHKLFSKSSLSIFSFKNTPQGQHTASLRLQRSKPPITMVFNLFFVLVNLISLAQAMAVPPQPGNEVHVVQRNHDAEGTFKTSKHLARTSKGLEARDNPIPHVIHCACGFNLDPNDADQAVINLGTNIGKGSDLEQDLKATVFGTSGSVIAFICQHDTADGMLIDTDTFGQYLDTVKKDCGSYTAGTNTIPGDSGNMSFGYMRYTPGLEDHVCDSPDSASAQSCPQ